jgi:transposase
MLFPQEAVERAMRMRDVIVRAISGEYTWLQAAKILDLSPRTVRRWRWRMHRYGEKGAARQASGSAFAAANEAG